MKLKVPFESEIKFNTSLCEITKISLEHEYTVNDSSILGNFIVSGEYKCHEISVNRDEFNKVLPFQLELDEAIDLDTIELEIDDFTYKVENNDTLKVFIEYVVKGELLERDAVFESVDEEDLNHEFDILNDLDEEESETEEMIEEEKQEEIKTEVEEVVEEIEEIRDIDEDTKNSILSSIDNNDDNYVTYHIHIIKESETIESICTLYKTNSIALGEYNDLSEFNIGDKIIIPFENE